MTSSPWFFLGELEAGRGTAASPFCPLKYFHNSEIFSVPAGGGEAGRLATGAPRLLGRELSARSVEELLVGTVTTGASSVPPVGLSLGGQSSSLIGPEPSRYCPLIGGHHTMLVLVKCSYYEDVYNSKKI